MARKPRNGSGRWIRATTRLAIYLRDGLQCLYCGRQFDGRCFDITLDHVVCYTKGGSHKPTNLITSCRSCNSSRQDKTVAQFATPEAKRRIRNARRRKLGQYRAMARVILNSNT